MEEAAKSVNTQLLKLRISEGNIEAVKELIPKIGDINQQLEHGWTILHLSVAKGEEEIVNVFLEADADPNICTKGETSPLMTAINKGHLKIVESLIQKGANVNYQDRENWSVLFSACLSGNEEIVDRLLNANADPNICTEEDKKSPLMIASQMGHISIIKKLLQAEADINKEDSEGHTAFQIAMTNGMDEVLEFFPLPEAFKKVLLELKDENIDVSEMKRKLRRMVENLISNSYEISPKLVKFFTKNGFEVNHTLDGKTVLYVAIKGNLVALVDALLENGADANICDNGMNSPLMLAAGKGYPHLVKKLLDNGADINKQNQQGQTALFQAVCHNKEAMVDVLLKLNANPNIANNDSKTPLMEASSDGHTSLVKKLLLYGANVNLKDTDGKTAYDLDGYNSVRRILEEAKKAGSMTGIGLEPQVAEHLSTVGAFLELKDENIDVAQLKEKMTEMRKTLKSFEALLGQDSVSDDESD